MWLSPKYLRIGITLTLILVKATIFAQEPQLLLIQDVTVIDGTGRPALPNRSVLVRGRVIDSISETAPKLPKHALIVDGKGKYLLPGLIDVHVHIKGGRNGKFDLKTGIHALHSYIYSGVTSVYDAGNNPSFITQLRQNERSEDLVAPRIFATGGIVTYPGSHGSSPGATLVSDWPEALESLSQHLQLQPDLIKLTYEERGWGSRPMIPLLPLDLMKNVIGFFKEHGVRSTVHTSSERRARQAISAGIDTLAHPVIQGPITQDFANFMGIKKIPMASTLTIGDHYSRLAEDPSFLDQPLYRASIEKKELQRLKTEESARQKERVWTWWMKIMTPVAQENIRMIHEAGGIIALGTDQSLGPAVHREMELLVEAGIPPLAVIRVATLNAALFLGKKDKLGSIEKGKLADLVMLHADPSENINNAKKIVLVIKNGRVVDRSRLDLPVNN
jgi:imidazolonepropionase-like amidohydrolase